MIAQQAGTSALPARTPEVRHNLVGLFTTDDYPAAAIRARQQGTVAVDLEIGPNGKVARCIVTESASPALDAATCDIISKRATYPPMRNKQGRAITTMDKARIRWVLPTEENPRVADQWFEVRALVSAVGPSKCSLRRSLAPGTITQAECEELVQANASFRPTAVQPPYVLTIREEQLIGDGIAMLPQGTGLARVIVRKHIAADGYVTSCEVIPEPLPNVDATSPYNCVVNGEYPPIPDEEPNKGDRIMTISWMRSFQPAGTEAK